MSADRRGSRVAEERPADGGWRGSAFVGAVLVVFLAMNMQRYGSLPVAARLEVQLWNVAIGAVLLGWVTALGTRRLPLLVSRDVAVASAVLVPLTAWLGFSALYSPGPGPATAVLLVQIGNLLVFLMVASLLRGGAPLGSLNRWLFRLGVALAVVSVAGYVYSFWLLLEGGGGGSGTRYFVGALHDRGLALRLSGFTQGPNFYALYMTLPLLAGLSLPGGRARWIGLGTIGTSLFLTLSRTYAAVFVATALVLVGYRLVKRRSSPEYFRYLPVAVAAILALAAGLLLASEELRSFVMARITSIEQQSRLALWARAVAQMDSPLVGEGLRSIDTALGIFSHNTYLDVFIETGAIGLFLWLGFVGLVTAKAVEGLRRNVLAPWAHTWFVLVAMSLTFSLLYNPLFFLVAAVLVGGSGRAREEGGPEGPPVGAAPSGG